ARELLLTTLKSRFQVNSKKTKKFLNQILNQCLFNTSTLINHYLWGKKIDLSLNQLPVTESDQNSKIGKDFVKNNQNLLIKSFDPMIPPDLFRTFLNTLRISENPRILEVGNKSGYYALCTWLAGYPTTFTSNSTEDLSKLYQTLTSYQSLIDQQLITPLNEQMNLPKFFLIKDELPTLDRFYGNEMRSYSGIIINYLIYTLSSSETKLLIQKISELLCPKGYIIVHEPYQENAINNVNNRKLINTEKSEGKLVYQNSLSSESIENLFKEMGYKLFLRIKYFNIHLGISWLFQLT
ncbi:MAG: hypothetical protein ACXAC7_22975, partial [Candidatus Hodarchaeales archaeon]